MQKVVCFSRQLTCGFGILFVVFAGHWLFPSEMPVTGHDQDLTQLQKEKLMAHSTDKYNDRRRLVKHYCDTHRNTDDDARLFNANFKDFEYWIHFDYKNELLYCEINKAGSTTWFNHLKM